LQKTCQHSKDNIKLHNSHVVFPSQIINIQISTLNIGSYVSVHLFDLRCIEFFENASSANHFMAWFYDPFMLEISIKLFEVSAHIDRVVVKGHESKDYNNKIKQPQIKELICLRQIVVDSIGKNVIYFKLKSYLNFRAFIIVIDYSMMIPFTQAFVFYFKVLNDNLKEVSFQKK